MIIVSKALSNRSVQVVLVLKSLCLPGQDFKCDFNSVLPSLSTSDREYNFDEFCSIAAEVMFLVRKLRNFRAYFSHHFQACLAMDHNKML